LSEIIEHDDRSDPDRLKKMLQLDYEFHTTLVQLSKNDILVRMSKELLQKSVRQWYIMFARVEKRIAEAVATGDAFAAADAAYALLQPATTALLTALSDLEEAR
jgi:DNA-binding GntR family transcriptional regulator